MRISAIANQKGGVGKTTTTVNLAAALAAQGVPVAALDLDPQGNTTRGLGVDASEVVTAYEVLQADARKRTPLVDALVPTPFGVYVLAADEGLSDIETNGNGPGGEMALARAIQQADLPAQGVILIDCPPSLGRLTVAALAAADDVIVTLRPGQDELNGTARLLDTIDLVRANLNPQVKVAHVLLTSYERTALAQGVEAHLRGAFPDEYAGVIRHTVRVGEAASRRQPVLVWRPESTAAKDYEAFGARYLERMTG